jgi:histidine ammonia-lyase
VLGAVRRAQVEAERAATVSLSSVTDNPVYVAPDSEHPHGAVYSTGGYHNSQAAPAMDGLAFAHADLCQLAERLTDHLFTHPETGPLIGGDEYTVKPLHMVQNGWAEEARSLAQPTLLSLGAFGQNDVPALSFLAWRKAMAVGNCLDAALAVLVAVASQVLHRSGRAPAPGLRSFIAEARDLFPPVHEPRPLGPDLQRLTDGFARRVFR